MKVSRFLVLFFVLPVFMLSWLIISDVEAKSLWTSTSGVLCWEAKGGETILKLRVSRIGGRDYFVVGEVIDKGNLKEIVHGNATIEGSNVLMTLVGSGKDSEELTTWIGHVILDISTLHGTFENIMHQLNYIDLSFETQYDAWNLTKISCPK